GATDMGFLPSAEQPGCVKATEYQPKWTLQSSWFVVLDDRTKPGTKGLELFGERRERAACHARLLHGWRVPGGTVSAFDLTSLVEPRQQGELRQVQLPTMKSQPANVGTRSASRSS